MKKNADILEKNMQEYSKKYPGDNMSVMYAIFNTHKETYYRALFFKVFNCMMRIAQDLLFFRFIAELENGKGAFTKEEMVFPAILGASVIGISILVRFIVSSVDFDIIEAGHLTHTSLKTILFRKNFRMSSASNKDFSTSEIDSIIMSDTDKFWDVIWEMH